LRLFSFGGYGLALAALALVVFGAIECPPDFPPVLSSVEPSGVTAERGLRHHSKNKTLFWGMPYLFWV